MQTILGANGTIGRLLAGELTRYTDRIRLVSRNPEKINENDELMPLDLTQPGAADKAVEGSEVAYLVIGFEYSTKVWEELWPRVMKDTIEACLKHNTALVFFDNVYMYDRAYLANLTESTPVNPSSSKGAVRKEVASMMLDAVRSRGLKGLIARSADFYGPGNENSFVYQMIIKSLAAGKGPAWFVGPGYKHSFTYTPDAAGATALLGNTPEAWGEVWHLPTDSRQITGKEFITMFAAEFGITNPKINFLPKWMLRPMGLFIPVMKEMPEMMYQYDRDYFFNSSKITGRFGIKATPYEEGIKATSRIYREK